MSRSICPLVVLGLLLPAQTTPAALAAAPTVSRPINPKPKLVYVKHWDTQTRPDKLKYFVSCDNFGGEGDLDETVGKANVCILVSCQGVSVSSTSGYNESVTWRRATDPKDLGNTRDQTLGLVYSPYDVWFSTWMERQTRTITWSSYVQAMGSGEPLPDYLRFYLDRMPDAGTAPIVYHLQFLADLQRQFLTCAP